MRKLWLNIWKNIVKIKPLKVIIIGFLLLLFVISFSYFTDAFLSIELIIFFGLMFFTFFAAIVGFVNWIRQDIQGKLPILEEENYKNWNLFLESKGLVDDGSISDSERDELLKEFKKNYKIK